MVGRVGNCKEIKEYINGAVIDPYKYTHIVTDRKMYVPLSCNLGREFVVRPQGLETQFYPMCKLISIYLHCETLGQKHL